MGQNTTFIQFFTFPTHIAIQIALDHINRDTNIHQEAAMKRCQARLEKKRQLEEEARKRKEEADLLETRQRELDEEKRVSDYNLGLSTRTHVFVRN